mmetsp:Transcript_20546/g.58400  ORF Transcript_20546/g.58400 Transcript_20546/m.58400 type:complete len:209 (+) Transcript_20546:425-1051(+)
MQAPGQLDIIHGRGKSIQDHLGNRRRLWIASHFKQAFRDAKDRKEKQEIKLKVYNEIRHGIQGLEIRFFRLDNKSLQYDEVDDEAEALKSIHHLLRDKHDRVIAPEEIDEINRQIEFERKKHQGEEKLYCSRFDDEGIDDGDLLSLSSVIQDHFETESANWDAPASVCENLRHEDQEDMADFLMEIDYNFDSMTHPNLDPMISSSAEI